jgi:hypothetical protein
LILLEALRDVSLSSLGNFFAGSSRLQWEAGDGLRYFLIGFMSRSMKNPSGF